MIPNWYENSRWNNMGYPFSIDYYLLGIYKIIERSYPFHVLEIICGITVSK